MIRQKFNISIRNQYQTLQNISENNDNIGPDLNEHWNKVKTMFNDTAVNVLGIRDSTRKRWISDTTWNVIEKRRSTKSKCNHARLERLKKKLQKEYSELNKEVKKKARKDKLQYIEGLANEAEEACKHGELSTVYKITKQLCGKSNNNDTPVLSKNGEIFHILLDLPCITICLDVIEKCNTEDVPTVPETEPNSSMEAYQHPFYRPMFLFFTRSEGGQGDTINRLDNFVEI
ncbi:AP-5 complex subunit zeta-1 [Mytilus galloprovincialis]|uniref:AP-5 complex subunit zeta-1 n=1 Tax=Mytilus galloprovincialis TaxID=29158 RepID=A0A8B6BF27_MYTGA|nr:AP-5 complex subunit zeta-1 [Mytilus galloprovincialis]